MNWNQSQTYQQGHLDCGYRETRMRVDDCGIDESICLIESFLRINHDHAEAHNDLAVLYYRKGDKLQTLGHYEKAFRLCPRNITFGKNLASFYFVEMGWTDDAIQICTDILKTHPEDVENLTALGIISKTIGRFEEARIFFRKVLDLEPWNDDARQAIESVTPSEVNERVSFVHEPVTSHIPQDVADIDSILTKLRKTISRLEDPPEASYQKACNLVNDGRIEDAISELVCLMKRNPGDGLIHNDLGVLYTREGNLNKALEHHQAAVSLVPLNSTFRKNLANLYYTVGKTDEAISIYTELLQETPDDAETLGALAIISIDKNLPAEAQVFLRKIIEIDPSNSDAYRLLTELGSQGTEGFFLRNR